MQKADILEGKRVLLVDDEPDIVETVEELLPACLIDKANSYQAGRRFLEKNSYDAAIFDIMGVKGYDLLKIANARGIPVLMFTAHALNPENMVKSLKEGALSYVPKDMLHEIAVFLREMLEARHKGVSRHGWLARLKPFFDQQFGPGWREKDSEFWRDFDSTSVVTKKELEDMM